VATGSAVTQDLVLADPHGLPPGTTITNHGTTSAGVPILLWTDSIALTTTGCAGATANYRITQGSSTVRSGSMNESPSGSGAYRATIDPLYPTSGAAQVTVSLRCPDGTSQAIDFTIYIDPAGTVVDPTGAPVAGANVTLLRSDTAGGPFSAVPDGSAVMSPAQRTNPVTTGPDGVFSWDVIAGYYQIQASKAGCHVPGGSETTATSAVYEVPPPALGIMLTLDCGGSPTSSTTTITVTPNPATVGQPVRLSAHLSGAAPVPTGTVAFSFADGPVTGCETVAVVNGEAACTTTFEHSASSPISVSATYSGDATHASSSGTSQFTVGPATPVLTWRTPGDITYPTPLDSTQLNATADIPGTFAYTVDGAQAAGTVLHAGAHQLTVVFTPTNGADYTTAMASVPFLVQAGQQIIVVDPVSPVTTATHSTTVTAHGGASGQPITFADASPSVCTVASTSGSEPATATVTIKAAGVCALLASQAGSADWAAAAPVTISFEVTSATTISPVLDTSVSADQASAAKRFVSPGITTRQGGELLVALISADGPANKAVQVKTVTSPGLTWTLVNRSPATKYGMVEVWQAWAPAQLVNTSVVATLANGTFDGSMSVLAFTNAAPSLGTAVGAVGSTGLPMVSITPRATGSAIWAVGQNWNVASPVIAAAGQTVRHQFLDARISDTFWTQSVDSAAIAGLTVAVSDTAPNTGKWQLTAIEVRPAAAAEGT
jgi:hypothetical protein